MTPREAIHECLRRLEAQGGPGFEYNTGLCLYQTADGRRCAVGIMLSQDLWERYPDAITECGGTVDELLDVLYDLGVGTPSTGLYISGFAPIEAQRFWRMMQIAHDDAAKHWQTDPGDELPFATAMLTKIKAEPELAKYLLSDDDTSAQQQPTAHDASA